MIAYLDEVGDHQLHKIDPQFPVFALMLAIFEQEYYAKTVTPAVCQLKLKYFGTDGVVLRSHDIRKRVEPFNILLNPKTRDSFFREMNAFLESLQCILFCVVINKQALKDTYTQPDNPYNLALEMVMERVAHYMEQDEKRSEGLQLIAESRGGKEDKDLELVFYRICSVGTSFVSKERFVNLNLSLKFHKKAANLPGHQIADLLCYPIARHILSPQKKMDLYDIAYRKLYAPSGSPHGWGLKIFP